MERERNREREKERERERESNPKDCFQKTPSLNSVLIRIVNS